MDEIIIRNAQRIDKVELLNLRNDPQIYLWLKQASRIDEETHETWIKSRLLNFEDATIVAIRSEILVGTAYLSEIFGGKAEVAIRVSRYSWGMGIGTILLKELIRRAPALGVSELHSSIHFNNSASRSLFKKFGFIEILNLSSSSAPMFEANFIEYRLDITKSIHLEVY